jgi:HD-like signal output (HDOD) protein
MNETDLLQAAEKLSANSNVLFECLKFIDSNIFHDNANAFYEINDLVKIVNQDVVLVAKVLQKANSIENYSRNNIADIKIAVLRIGPRELREIVFELVGRKVLETNKKDDRHLNTRQIIGYAKTAEKTIKYCIDKSPIKNIDLVKNKYSIYYISLLQDIGMTTLFQYDPNMYIEILRKSNNSIRTLMQNEQEKYLGNNHVTLAMKILTQWNFPCEFIEAISHQHSEIKTNNSDQLGSIIQVANMIFYMKNKNEHNNWYISELKKNEMKELIENLSHVKVGDNIIDEIYDYDYDLKEGMDEV